MGGKKKIGKVDKCMDRWIEGKEEGREGEHWSALTESTHQTSFLQMLFQPN